MPIPFSVGKKVIIGIAKSARLDADVVHVVSSNVAHVTSLPSYRKTLISLDLFNSILL
jgi:hypothetical protein